MRQLRGIFRTGGVEATPDLARVLALPRRQPGLLLRELTQVLAQPGGAQSLRPAQALALFDLADYGGLLAPLKCGAGKTLVTLLAARMLDCKRPILLIPASRRERTREVAAELAQHWRVWLPPIYSYEELGRHTRANLLRDLAPDLIIGDECHYLCNMDAGVTRRVHRYWQSAPGTAFALLSGTVTGPDLMRQQHLMAWALGGGSPLPLVRAECDRWQRALYPPEPARGIGLGALTAFGRDPGKGLAEHIRATPGVVGTSDPGCEASLVISKWRPALPPALAQLIEETELMQQRPDGVDLLDDFAGVAVTLGQMALGFWYRWDPPAPAEWLRRRKTWARFVRDVLAEEKEGFDTELQVRLAHPEVAAPWLEIRDTFVPNNVPVWEASEVMEAAHDWARQNHGIVWTRYRAVGHALERLGLPYHGQHGLDAKGRFIEAAKGPVAAGIRSCGTGANLQRWHRNLVLTLPARAEPWEQLISRTHREGQTADTVYVEAIRVIPQHARTLYAIKKEAELLTALGDTQRLSIGDWI